VYGGDERDCLGPGKRVVKQSKVAWTMGHGMLRHRVVRYGMAWCGEVEHCIGYDIVGLKCTHTTKITRPSVPG